MWLRLWCIRITFQTGLTVMVQDCIRLINIIKLQESYSSPYFVWFCFPGRLSYKSDRDAQSLAEECKLQILVLRMFGTESHYSCSFGYRLELYIKKKTDIYGKRQTSNLRWEFLRIENKQIETAQNSSYRDKTTTVCRFGRLLFPLCFVFLFIWNCFCLLKTHTSKLK